MYLSLVNVLSLPGKQLQADMCKICLESIAGPVIKAGRTNFEVALRSETAFRGFALHLRSLIL